VVGFESVIVSDYPAKIAKTTGLRVSFGAAALEKQKYYFGLFSA
jgi:hypothetical protein